MTIGFAWAAHARANTAQATTIDRPSLINIPVTIPLYDSDLCGWTSVSGSQASRGNETSPNILRDSTPRLKQFLRAHYQKSTVVLCFLCFSAVTCLITANFGTVCHSEAFPGCPASPTAGGSTPRGQRNLGYQAPR